MLVFVVVVPLLLDFALRREFPVHNHGVVVISGCSSGIGKHAAFELAKLGYVVFAGVRKESDGQQLKDEFAKVSSKKKHWNQLF